VEITDEQAALVAQAQLPDGYFLIEGEFITAAEKRERDRAARYAERLAAMTPEQRAAMEARAAAKAAYDAAAAAFEAMPLGKQALWDGVRQKVGQAILAGDFTTAREILETTPVIYPGAEDDRAVFLALFPA